jgi:ABC-type transporter Mla maintaining outer membrane lipid asymmetry ATPase subunit MlaF
MTDAISPAPAVEARGVDVTLGGHAILSGVDLTVRTGEVVALTQQHKDKRYKQIRK